MDKKWTIKDFPVGLHPLHPDQSVNFQMNRFYNWSNDPGMLEEMKKAGENIHSYDDYIRSFTALGDEALKRGEKLKAALYFRGAEFFIPEGGPNKQELRGRFISLNNEYYGITKNQHYLIPYGEGCLSAYRFAPETPKGTVIFLNGFDGYIEELTRMFLIFRDAGYDTIAFDGPGQGSVLEDYHIPMTHEWERLVKTVLDYFGVDDTTVIGGSLGGCLALRSAAYEKRIKRAICYDIFPDFFSIAMRQVPPAIRNSLKGRIAHGTGKKGINTLINQMMKKSLMLEWGLAQGMHVLGCDSPYDFFRKTVLFSTADCSPIITQDVLLLAGQDDHYVPIGLLPEQISLLTSVHSLTARMFTAKESAASHCQLGNIGLAVEVMLNWIEQTSTHSQC